MTENSTEKLDKFQSQLNSKRTLFNIIVYIILPVSLILTFIYSLLLTRENKVDYLLYITFVTIIYSIVVLLINLLKDDKNMVGLRYIINKLGIDGDYDTSINLTMNDEKNSCDLSFIYPDKDDINKSFSEISPKTSKIIGGDIKTDVNNVTDKMDKDFYNRCDVFENSSQLFKIKGTCLGKTSSDMITCGNLIKDATNSDEAFEKCNNASPQYVSYIIVSISIISIIIADSILLIFGLKLWSDIINVLSFTLLMIYTVYEYYKKPNCDYIDLNYPNIAVSPFSNYLLNSIMLGATFKILSTTFKIYILGSPEYTWLLIYFTILSSVYVIKDYSFISVLEDSYSGFGKFINVMKLNRNTDKIDYNMNFVERSTNKRCIVDGLWDKKNTPPQIEGGIEGCNPDVLGKYLNN